MDFESKLQPYPEKGLHYDYFISLEDYNKLTKEEKQELDRNYWRFGDTIHQGYALEVMTEKEKALFKDEEMVVY